MEPLPCATFEDAFAAVETGKADLAMIPIENTIAGRVADIHHILPDSKLHIIGEYFLPIHFQLMVLPGVERARSPPSTAHPRARPVPQIHRNEWLEAGGRGRYRRRAKMVAELQQRSMAALAPGLAATLYGLDILEENVEDNDKNVTRLVVLTRSKDWVARPVPDAQMMTTFIFRVRNVPAALYKAMGGFATTPVNMTKLEKLPARCLHRDAVLRGYRGPSGRSDTSRSRGGAALLLARGAHPRRLSGEPLARRMEAFR